MTININEALDRVKNSIYGKDIRQAIIDAVNQVYTDASVSDNANMEVVQARALYKTLTERLAALDVTDAGLSTGVNAKRDKNVPILLADLAQEVKTSMTGGSVAVVGEKSVQEVNIVDNQVTPRKTNFFNEVLNFFNKATSRDGYDINSNGTDFANSSYTQSDWIEVLPNTQYKVTNSCSVVYFTAKNLANVITGRTSASSTAPFTTPANVTYIKLAMLITVKDAFMLSLSSSLITKYEPFNKAYLKKEYISKLGTDYLESKSVTPDKTSFFYNSPNLFNKDTLTANFLIEPTAGTLTANVNYKVSDYIPVEGAATYVLNKTAHMAFYDINKVYISGINSANYTKSTPIVAPDRAAFYRFSATNWDYDGTVQFEKGSVPTAYDSYGVQYVQSNLVNVDYNRNLEDVTEYNNIAGVFDASKVSGYKSFITKTVNPDGSLTLTANATADDWFYFYYTLKEAWKNGHSYFVSMQISLDSDSGTFDNSGGNMTLTGYDPRYNNVVLASGNDNIKKNAIITRGTTANMISQFNINTTQNTAATVSYNTLFMQPVKALAGKPISITLKNIVVVDMGLTSKLDSTYDQAYALFTKYGYVDKVIVKYVKYKAHEAKQADVALVALNVPTVTAADIEFWGDSLVAQDYASNVKTITGRNCFTHGYGGRTSTYIRDMFLANANKNNSIVINVGRNNYTYPDRVVYDIRKMVASLPHNRFIICSPPNGDYSGEWKATAGNGLGGSYHYFTDIEDRLAKEYPNNFLNTRLASIYEYDMGAVELKAPFVQPAVGSTVQINVTDTAFLTTFNPNEETPLLNKIRIGDQYDKMDLYDVVSVQNANLMTVRLTQINNIATGATVQNIPDAVEPTSFVIQRVIQEADYQCYLRETTASTFRQDDIHMSPRGRQCLANIIARAIKSINI
jgi:hypothetical protein